MSIKNSENQINEKYLKSTSDSQPVQVNGKDFFVFPLSYQQESLWFIDQLEPGRAIYNIPFCLKVEGKLNIPALEKSLKIMINRHEVLRTCFDIVNGEISQIVYKNQDFKIRVVELSNFPFEERLEKALSLANDEVRSSFDLKKSPLFRCHIIKLDDLNHLLTFTFHHIIFDGWSAGIFIKELGNLYNNLNAGENTLPYEPPLQYADFAIWQREWFQSETKQKQLKFWKEELKDSNTSLELPADFIRPVKQSYNGNLGLIKLPADLVEDLKSLSLTQGATLFMTLLSALKILIYRYSGQTDISVGSPIAIRNSEELENLLGFYVNTIVFRSALEDNLSFKDLLAQVRQRSLNIFENLDLPFDKVVEEIQPKRELNRNPLFQIMFALQTIPEYESNFDDLKIEPVQLGTGVSKFDLLVELKESKRGIEGFIEYATDLFKADSVKRLADHFEILLREIISNPDKNISDYSLLSPEENKFLDSINNTEILYSGPQSLHKLFEEQVEKTPDKIAVEFEGKILTYSELNAKSNQVADYLRKLGIQAGSLVGICVDRSLEMFIGMIGILKTGCAYVPMDPAFPADRLNFMLEDANIRILLTSNNLKKIFNQQDVKFLLLDGDWEFIEKENDKNVHSQISSEKLAYVIYTSGSTGKPKGVQITHEAVVNFLHSMQEKPGLTPDDIFVSVTTISFDISVLELFLPIITGAKLIIANKAATSDGNLLLKLLKETNASIMQATPATWRMMIESGWESSPNLKMLCGGEALPLELANQLLERGSSLWNMYGPTETTIWSAVKKIEPGSDAVLIGPPIANTQFYILDKKTNPVPINVPGELLIGGDGLAKGYLNRSELTNEKFIPNPFLKSGARLYRTGDLARFKPNGDVEFLGRLDFQVKIRGFRIELGEIEKVLELMDTIQSTLVIGKEFGAGDMRLIAYIIPSSESTVDVKQIKNYLAQKLPDYMIPSFFVSMEKFPLTPNGKIDRKNLPAPDDLAVVTKSEYAPATNELEIKLVGIWQKILKIDKIGVNDDFFDIGGHSLLATQLSVLIENTFNKKLSLAEIFQTPTIKQLAEKLRLIENEHGNLPAIERVERSKNIPLSFAQQRLLFLDQLEPNNPVYNIALTFRIEGDLKFDFIRKALNQIVSRHEVLRTRFIAEDGVPYQDIVEKLELNIPLIDLTNEDVQFREAVFSRILNSDTRYIFDLSKGPLILAKIYKLGVSDHALFILMHHTVSDGWSNSILLKEFSELYSSFANDSPVIFPELSVQYADFSVWQKEWLSDKRYNQQLAYWKKQLSGELPLLDLVTDYPRPPIQSYSGNSIYFSIDQDFFNRVSLFGKQENVSVFMILLSALNVLIYRYSGQTDVSVGSPIANRTRPELYDMIGFFSNTLVFRNQFSETFSFREILNLIRENCLAAYDNQDIPFEELVEEIKPERDLSHTPLFQIMLTYQEDQQQFKLSSDLSVKPVYADPGTAKTDLVVNVFNSGEELICLVEYCNKLYRRETINQFIAALKNILKRVCESPETPISKIPLLNKEEEFQLITEWNNTKVDYPASNMLHELFEEQVEKTPDKIAVEFEGKILTYSELNAKSNQVADYLRKLGIQAGSLVGICIDRSLEMLIGIISILKTGCAYVPMDPEFPPDRLNYMLEDANIMFLLTSNKLKKIFDRQDLKFVLLDDDWEFIEKENDKNVHSQISSEELSYVIYTSGSTGKPKGVQIKHKAVVNFLLSMQAKPGLTPDDILVSVTTISFDISVLELFLPIITGAKLIIANKAATSDGNLLLKLLKETNASIMQATPATWRMMIESGWESSPNLKMLCGGEALPLELANQMLERGGSLWNMYGPTETTIWSSVKKIEPGSDAVLIGPPIANTQFYILDKKMNPVPINVPGELLIGGDGLAKGYLNRSELTNEKFIPNPFSQSGLKLYRTGDLARFKSNGDVEFLRRLDFQVKIRGFRIELGEIEKVLESMDSIQSALVIGKEFGAGDMRLIAYFIPASETTIDVKQIKNYLAQKLTDYMIPSFFVSMEKFPLTPNGKIDRKNLPAPEDSAIAVQNEYVPPSNDTESKLIEIWKKVLGLNKIGVIDNFFEIGGHSLLAARLFVQIEKEMGESLPLAVLFQAPTIKEISDIIKKKDTKAIWSTLVPIRKAGSKPPLFLVHGAEGNVLLYRDLANYLGEDQPVYGFQSKGLDGKEELVTHFPDMAANYIKEMKKVQQDGPYYLGGYCMGGAIAYEMAQQLKQNGDEVALIALLESYNIRQAPDRFPFYYKIYHYIQHIGFQIGNIILSKSENRSRYFKDKLKLELSRYKIKFNIVLSKLSVKAGIGKGLNYTHLMIDKINDKAQSEYIPQKYDGKVALFKPKRYYAGLNDPSFGWGKLTSGGIKIIEIPINPRGILNEPFVKDLARKLKEEIEQSINVK